MDARWMMDLHYNEYTAQAPNAGWNGFSTMGDFYNSFGAAGGYRLYVLKDTVLDTRLGAEMTS